MDTGTISISNIVSQIKKLKHSEKINVLEKIVSLIKSESEAGQKIPLSSISGLGSEIWKDADIDAYVENERKWD